MNKKVKLFVALLLALVYAALPAMADDKPIITLQSVEVASIQPFYVKPRIGYKSEKEPGQEMTYGYSSTLGMAYIFEVKNPGKASVMLDELQFTTAFEGFDLNTVLTQEDIWIPAGKASQLRVVVINEAFPTIVSLSVGAEHATRIQEMKTSAGALVSKWWNQVSDFSFPITITNGNAIFKDEKGKELRVAFGGEWPKK